MVLPDRFGCGSTPQRVCDRCRVHGLPQFSRQNYYQLLGVPADVTPEQLGQYIQDYADFHGVSDLECHFNAAVTSVFPLKLGDEGTGWRVEWCTSDGSVQTAEFGT